MGGRAAVPEGCANWVMGNTVLQAGEGPTMGNRVGACSSLYLWKWDQRDTGGSAAKSYPRCTCTRDRRGVREGVPRTRTEGARGADGTRGRGRRSPRW